MTGLLDYSSGNSVLHRLNPLSKLFIAVLLCVASFVCQNHLTLVGIIAISIILSLIGGIAGRALSMLKTLTILSVFLFLLQVFFVRDGNILLSLPLNIYITDKGISFSLIVVLRLIAATMPLALMLSLTRMSDLSNALVQRLFIPYKYAFALTTAIRFIPTFTSEMQGIMQAQTARGVEFDTKNPFKKIRLILPLCVPLLISSVKRIEGGAISAELKGFNLRKRKSGYDKHYLKPRDFAAMLCAVSVACISAFL